MPGLTINLWRENYHKNGKEAEAGDVFKGAKQ